MSICETGTFCSNFAFLRNKIKRITKSLKCFQKTNDPQYLNFEINIFLDSLDNLPDIIQKCADNMEKGLELRKEFLESKNLEQEYQIWKNIKNNKT